jgi:TolA-binding protein
MRPLLWLLLAATAGGFAYWLLDGLRRFREKKEAQAVRAAVFLAQAAALAAPKAATPPAAPAPAANGATEPQALAQQKLLFEAAEKAGEAGEPFLAIQLYGRLIARYPESALARQARTGLEAQKKKLATAQSSG